MVQIKPSAEGRALKMKWRVAGEASWRIDRADFLRAALCAPVLLSTLEPDGAEDQENEVKIHPN